MTNLKRVAIYLRVSTRKQSTGAQHRELIQITERAGWQPIEIYTDAGISGAKGRGERPGFDRMLKDATRCHFDVLNALVGRSARS